MNLVSNGTLLYDSGSRKMLRRDVMALLRVLQVLLTDAKYRTPESRRKSLMTWIRFPDYVSKKVTWNSWIFFSRPPHSGQGIPLQHMNRVGWLRPIYCLFFEALIESDILFSSSCALSPWSRTSREVCGPLSTAVGSNWRHIKGGRWRCQNRKVGTCNIKVLQNLVLNFKLHCSVRCRGYDVPSKHSHDHDFYSLRADIYIYKHMKVYWGGFDSMPLGHSG